MYEESLENVVFLRERDCQSEWWRGEEMVERVVRTVDVQPRALLEPNVHCLPE